MWSHLTYSTWHNILEYCTCLIQHADLLEDQCWCQVPQKQIFIIWHQSDLVCAVYVDVCFSTGVRGCREVLGVWRVYLLFVFVLILLFLCFWHIFSLYTLLTVSNVPFLFGHLFTYCVIDGDLKRASFILLHSLLSQFHSVVLKWGNSSCTAYLLCRISVIACVCNCLQFSYLWCLYKIHVWWHWITQVSIFQDRGIGNTSLSTFGVAQAVLEIILMLYPLSDPAFVYGWSSMAKSNIVQPALFTQDIV